jgi:ABC-type amino acid transport substrate-binding protein
MECGASTVTISRMKQVDFSSYIFVDSTGLIARSDLNARSLSDLSGKKIGVIAGTSNESALQRALKERLVTATVVPLKSREGGASPASRRARSTRSRATRSCCWVSARR